MMINEAESTTWRPGLVAVLSMLAGGCISVGEDRGLDQSFGTVAADGTGEDQHGGSGDTDDTGGTHATDGSDTGADPGATASGDETDTDGTEVDDTTGTTGDEGDGPIECPSMVSVSSPGNLAGWVYEASGLAASRTAPGLLWTHNDNQHRFIFVILSSGELLRNWEIPGVTVGDGFDFEDIAVGPGPVPGQSYVYVGDIGDNGTPDRPFITIHRFVEPQDPAGDGLFAGLDTRFDLVYPDGPHDAETLMVDPVDAAVYLVAEVLGEPRLYRAPTPLESGETLEDLGLVNAPFLPTAGDISPGGDFIVMRGASEGGLWPRAPGQTITDALKQAPCEIPIQPEEDGQAIAVMPDGLSYMTTSEGHQSPMWHYEL